MNTVSLCPTWETAVRIYVMCLKNPKAGFEAHKSAEDDLIRLARVVDELQSNDKQQEMAV